MEKKKKKVNVPFLYLYIMSELLCAGKARNLHVKFSAFATVTSAVGSSLLRCRFKASLWGQRTGHRPPASQPIPRSE